MTNDVNARCARGRKTASPVTSPPERGEDKFSALAEAMREVLGVTETAATLPPFLRLPRSGERCPVSGFSRSFLNCLILGGAPEVESIVIRKPGKVRGIRLVSTESLLDFIRAQGVLGKGGAK